MTGFLKIFLAISFLLLPTFAGAHILKVDGNIGVILHVNPEDDPIVGEVANFYFEIKDKEGKFDLARCECTVKILKSGEEVFSSPLSLAMDYVFRERAVYRISVSGNPKDSGEFDPFSVNYDLRVSREGDEIGGQGNNNLLLPIAGLIIIVLIALYFKFRK